MVDRDPPEDRPAFSADDDRTGGGQKLVDGAGPVWGRELLRDVTRGARRHLLHSRLQQAEPGRGGDGDEVTEVFGASSPLTSVRS